MAGSTAKRSHPTAPCARPLKAQGTETCAVSRSSGYLPGVWSLLSCRFGRGPSDGTRKHRNNTLVSKLLIRRHGGEICASPRAARLHTVGSCVRWHPTPRPELWGVHWERIHTRTGTKILTFMASRLRMQPEANAYRSLRPRWGNLCARPPAHQLHQIRKGTEGGFPGLPAQKSPPIDRGGALLAAWHRNSL